MQKLGMKDKKARPQMFEHSYHIHFVRQLLLSAQTGRVIENNPWTKFKIPKIRDYFNRVQYGLFVYFWVWASWMECGMW